MKCCDDPVAASTEGHPDQSRPPALGPAELAFQRMKSLAGDWAGQSSDGKDLRLTYKVASKESIVIEFYKHFYQGVWMEDEMVTVYHLDEGDLVCTHYCTLGNQPRMKAVVDDPDRVRFEFVGATNLLHPESLRMSGVDFHFVDDDHFTQTWYWYGKKRYVAESNKSDDFDEIEDEIDPETPGRDVFTLARAERPAASGTR